MSRVALNDIPKVERQVEFSENDFRDVTRIIRIPEEMISKEEWMKVSKEALVLTGDNEIMQYAVEYPIVRYMCCGNTEGRYAKRDFNLNMFIKDITVSTGMNGKRFSLASGKIESSITEFETLVYYRDNKGYCMKIREPIIAKFLLKKPEMVVSPEGVIIFFTERYMLATLDCNNYVWVDVISPDLKTYKAIKAVEACSNYCKIVKIDEFDSECKFKLNFDFDFATVGTDKIIPRVSKL